MKHPRRSATVLFAAGVLSGCGLINVNGKPLGGSSPSPGPMPTASAPQAAASSGEAPAPSASASASAGSTAPGTTPAADPSRLCASAEPANHRTLAELDEKVAAGMTTKGTSRWTMPGRAFINAICATEGELVQQRAAVIARKNRWMATFSFDDRDFAAIAKYDPNSTTPELTTFDGPLGQFGRIHAESYQSSRMDIMDRLGASATMMARVALVAGCFSLRETSDPTERLDEAMKSHSLLSTILCTRQPIDVRKAWAEIDAATQLHPDRRIELRQLVLVTRAAATAAEAKIVELGKQEPGVVRLVAVADAEFKQWASPSARRVTLVRQLEAVERAASSNKRSDAVDCENATQTTWAAHVKSLKLPRAPDRDQIGTYLTHTLASADGYLAYVALRMCLATKHQDAGADDKRRRRPSMSSDSYTMGLNLERRGPWSSTIAAWTGADKAIEFDDRRRTMKGLLMDGNLGGYNNYVSNTPEAGVIASITDVDGGVEVKFKTVREPRVVCTKSETTNRIRRISPSGDVSYETICTATAKVMADITAKPVRMDKVLSRGLSPGLYLVAFDGLPIVATRSPSSDVPVFVLGAKAN